MNTSRFGSKIDANMKLELLYVATAIAIALALVVNLPRSGKTTDTRMSTCFTNICFA